MLKITTASNCEAKRHSVLNKLHGLSILIGKHHNTMSTLLDFAHGTCPANATDFIQKKLEHVLAATLGIHVLVSGVFYS